MDSFGSAFHLDAILLLVFKIEDEKGRWGGGGGQGLARLQ
jgi:hypothetical protein